SCLGAKRANNKDLVQHPVFLLILARALQHPFGVFEHGGDVAVDSDFAVGLFDQAVGADQEAAADDAHVFFAVIVLLAPDAVGVGQCLVGVGEQRRGQPVFLSELRVAL